MVVIHDVTAGAIYNNSLVTYHEPVLLYDDHHYATANKQRVAIIVAHELLRQWFGKLVPRSGGDPTIMGQKAKISTFMAE